MHKKVVIKPNLYFDSATLMAIAQKAKGLDGVVEAVAVMATEANKELLSNVGLLDEAAKASTPRDLILAVAGEREDALDRALEFMETALEGDKQPGPGAESEKLEDLREAIDREPGINMALISVPGQYAASEARKALRAGLHVMLFSDNVPIDQEIELKKLAAEKGLLMMGPDCGTAIISGAPLAFANVVRRGNIGIVAAAGTGLQEIACLIHNWGGGISQAIGTGGRDVKEEVGGRQFIRGLRALMDDDATEVIVLTGKPPAPAVEDKILRLAASSQKPVIVNLLAGNPEKARALGLLFADTLEGAARRALERAGIAAGEAAPLSELAREAAQGLAPGQRWIRGLYTGGTLCYEACLILQRQLGNVYSNTPTHIDQALLDSNLSFQHCVVDLGDDEYTRGRPHPMIEPSIRSERIELEGSDSEVAVILLDVVLGYGSHREPVEVMAPSIERAAELARRRGGKLVFAASVTGSDEDPQQRQRQVRKLRELGVYVLPSNCQAVHFAAEVVRALGRDR